MSSHREAPEISKDPVADSTDVYAFVSPDRPDTVTIITNYIPLEDPAGGPNFFEFGDDVLYSINIDNDNDGRPEIVYEFTFTTTNTNPDTFLYNTGPIDTHRQPQLQPPPDLRRHRGPPRRAPAAGQGPAGPAVQRRDPVDAELPGARPVGDLRRRRQRHQGVRRAASRRLLRRPRVGVRPRRAASVPEPPPHLDAARRPASTRCGRSTCTRSPSRSRSPSSRRAASARRT